ncbi:MAG TPA: hypothetical protein VG722_09620, partial [Tepidisphaeraceae bacterium]|nr:hypothetical protein [Tepidisphaeraceae bacterium]
MCAHHVARARISVVIGFLAFVSFLGIHQSASAQDLTATLENVVFDDGGTASGSFTYYYDPNPSQELLTMDSALITTTVGTAYAGTVYDYNDTYTI